MMSKLYYDDPLKAAIMARDFGVKYRAKPRGLAVTCDVSIDDGMGERINIKPNGDIYYVHKDSADIFKPMVGDVLSDTSSKCLEVVDNDWEKRNKWDGGRIRYSKMITICDAQNRFVKGFSKIIQRDGKSFFTPEVAS